MIRMIAVTFIFLVSAMILVIMTLTILFDVLITQTDRKVIMHSHNETALERKDVPKKIDDVEKVSDASHDVRYSQEELHLLAQLVSAEAKGEPFDGMVAVANVVLNRVEHEQFPDTIKEVIMQPRQFDPVRNGTINQDPTEKALKASRSALEGHTIVSNAIYFYNPEIATDGWIRTRDTITKIGDHVFAN